MPGYRPLPVWSRLQRLIHWTIAFSVLLLIPLGALLLASQFLHLPEKSHELVMYIHASIGFVLGAGTLTRLIYLFTGPPASRWTDVVPHTGKQWELGAATVRYYLSGFRGKAPVYFNHNPVAGLFDTVLFIFLATQFLSGASMFLLGPEEHVHVANHTHEGQWPPLWLETVHLAGAGVIIAFVLSHFTALAAHDIMEHRGLISSMVSGNKFFDKNEIEELKDEITKKAGSPPDSLTPY